MKFWEFQSPSGATPFNNRSYLLSQNIDNSSNFMNFYIFGLKNIQSHNLSKKLAFWKFEAKMSPKVFLRKSFERFANKKGSSTFHM